MQILKVPIGYKFKVAMVENSELKLRNYTLQTKDNTSFSKMIPRVFLKIAQAHGQAVQLHAEFSNFFHMVGIIKYQGIEPQFRHKFLIVRLLLGVASWLGCLWVNKIYKLSISSTTLEFITQPVLDCTRSGAFKRSETA